MIRTIHADNLEALHTLYGKRSIDLAYLDPPFFTGWVFKTGKGETAFDDRWPNRETYLMALGKRLRLLYNMLAPHGSLVIHVDWRMSHYVKVWCDHAFGVERFASEIIWHYRRWPSKTLGFQRMHDVLLHYRKDQHVTPRFNQLYEPLAPSTVATWGSKKQEAVVKNGKRVRSSLTEHESPGVPMSDVWNIGVIAPISKERVDYPTQKPVKLLERVIGALSNPGDLVVDPYMGSGTTLVVAKSMGRDAIGIDSSALAVKITKSRLQGTP